MLTGGTVETIAVGNEAEPVVIVDNATGMVDALIEFAATRTRFEPAQRSGSGYPGLLGTAPAHYMKHLVELATGLLPEMFGTGRVGAVRARGNFSLVTTPPAALTIEQRLPHVDAADRHQFAMVHYLTATTQGTGFFHHLSTGFETVDAERITAYNAAVTGELVREAPQGYPLGDEGMFKRTFSVEPCPDRVILYRAALLHSGLIGAIGAHAANPRRGRLTGNLFLQCRPAA